ncbi:type II toxin-antitoxin system RelE/ParE family toxin [bacterium]|nr:type II toxin-antitoxin system RelE/ParE family toxin [bacterium]
MADVHLSQQAHKNLRDLRNPAIIKQIIAQLERLIDQPRLGKLLGDELQGYRAVRAARGRYRIVYEYQEEQNKIVIIRIGIRRDRDRSDVYQQLKRDIRRSGR